MPITIVTDHAIKRIKERWSRTADPQAISDAAYRFGKLPNGAQSKLLFVNWMSLSEFETCRIRMYKDTAFFFAAEGNPPVLLTIYKPKPRPKRLQDLPQKKKTPRDYLISVGLVKVKQRKRK